MYDHLRCRATPLLLSVRWHFAAAGPRAACRLAQLQYFLSNTIREGKSCASYLQNSATASKCSSSATSSALFATFDAKHQRSEMTIELKRVMRYPISDTEPVKSAAHSTSLTCGIYVQPRSGQHGRRRLTTFRVELL